MQNNVDHLSTLTHFKCDGVVFDEARLRVQQIPLILGEEIIQEKFLHGGK